MDYTTIGKRILHKSVCTLDERTYGSDIATQLVHTRTEHSTFHLYHILIARNDGINSNRVTISKME